MISNDSEIVPEIKKQPKTEKVEPVVEQKEEAKPVEVKVEDVKPAEPTQAVAEASASDTEPKDEAPQKLRRPNRGSKSKPKKPTQKSDEEE